LIFYCRIIMLDLTKYSLFQNVFDYRGDHNVKIFNDG
jgi:hypothetical protein